MISFRRVVSGVAVGVIALFSLGACTIENNITAPTASTSALGNPSMLVLPAFGEAEHFTALYPEGFTDGVLLPLPSVSYDVCAEIVVSYTGNSIERIQHQCTRAVDPSGVVQYSIWISMDIVRLGISQVVVTPKHNPQGRTSILINVNSIATGGNCCKG